MRIFKKPFRWISAHRESLFTFNYDYSFPLIAVGDDSGKAVFIFAGDGIHEQTVGDLIYVTSGVYKGYHKITELLYANWYKTETQYTTLQNGGNVTFVEDAVFTLYSGYSTGALSTLLPYTKIAEFKPEPNSDGQLVVNISGYVNKIFDVINSNDTTAVGSLVVYYNLFNQVKLFIDNSFVNTNMAANAAISMYELNQLYVDTGRNLNAGSLGEHYLSCGETDAIRITEDFIIRARQYMGGVIIPLPGGFDSNDFNASDFDTVGG